MKEEEILKKLVQLVSKKTNMPIAKITPTSEFKKDLALDSLTMAELMMEVEDAFEVTISDEDAEGIKQLKHAVEYIQKRARK